MINTRQEENWCSWLFITFTTSSNETRCQIFWNFLASITCGWSWEKISLLLFIMSMHLFTRPRIWICQIYIDGACIEQTKLGFSLKRLWGSPPQKKFFVWQNSSILNFYSQPLERVRVVLCLGALLGPWVIEPLLKIWQNYVKRLQGSFVEFWGGRGESKVLS